MKKASNQPKANVKIVKQKPQMARVNFAVMYGGKAF